jgi:hypothetical protein
MSSTCTPYGRRNVLALNGERDKEPGAARLERAHAAELLSLFSATEAATRQRASCWDSWDSTLAAAAPSKSGHGNAALPPVPAAVKQALLELSPYSFILAKPAPASPYSNTPSKVYKDWRVSGVLPERRAAVPLPELSQGAWRVPA